jgi:hypothetical protein
MRRFAETGAPTHEIAAWSGHKTLKMVDHYTVDFNRAKLAEDLGARVERSRSVPGELTNMGTTDLQTSSKSRA